MVVIQLMTKSHSLYGEKIHIDSRFIPRIGEIINVGPFVKIPEGEVTTFIVESVVYKLTEYGFIPHITARQWVHGWRHELLKERMWLEPDDGTEKCYDEDDPAILD